MPSALLDRMKMLCSLPGPPGHESAVRDAIAEMLKGSASELRRDDIGNLIARHEANEAAPHLVLECHMDEVGLVVTGVEAGGAIRFEKVGLVADSIFPGREVSLLTLDRESPPGRRERAKRTSPDLAGPGTPRRG